MHFLNQAALVPIEMPNGFRSKSKKKQRGLEIRAAYHTKGTRKYSISTKLSQRHFPRSGGYTLSTISVEAQNQTTETT